MTRFTRATKVSSSARTLSSRMNRTSAVTSSSGKLFFGELMIRSVSFTKSFSGTSLAPSFTARRRCWGERKGLGGSTGGALSGTISGTSLTDSKRGPQGASGKSFSCRSGRVHSLNSLSLQSFSMRTKASASPLSREELLAVRAASS